MRCNLTESSLKNAIFTKARATRSQFIKATLNGLQAPQSIWHLTNLEGADCQNTVFSHADLIGSNLRDANFKGANLYQTRVDLTQREGAKFDLDAFVSTSAPNKDYASYVMANS